MAEPYRAKKAGSSSVTQVGINLKFYYSWLVGYVGIPLVIESHECVCVRVRARVCMCVCASDLCITAVCHV